MPGVVSVTWARLDFDSDPLTFDHAPFFSKKQQKQDKNGIFLEKLGQDRTLILRYLDSPMTQFSPEICLLFSILASFKEKNGAKIGQKLKKEQTLGTSYFRNNLNF